MTNTKQAQCTPGPWRISMMPSNPNQRIVGADNALILVVSEGAAFAKPTEANAAFIIRACNAWDDADALRARIAELEAKWQEQTCVYCGMDAATAKRYFNGTKGNAHDDLLAALKKIADSNGWAAGIAQSALDKVSV